MLTIATVDEPVALADIDLYDDAVYRTGRPHALWRTLRADDPISMQHTPDGTPFWSVTRYRDVVGVLRDTRRFSSEYSTMLSMHGGDPAIGKAIHLTDPPRHSTVRTTTTRPLSMRVLRRHENAIRARVRGLVATALDRGELDFAELVTVLPMLTAGDVLGIPEDMWTEAARWTVASMAPDDALYAVGTGTQATLRAAHVFLFSLFVELIEARRADPRDDLVSLLLAMSVDGRPATDEEVLVNCYAFIMGANPTVPQAASHFVLAMAEDPALWQRIRSDPALLPTVLEETLRWSSPVNHLLRRATEDVRLGSHLVPAGGLVAAWIASANRDESVFAEPYVFDPARRPNPHITFGHGAHRCVGNAVALAGLRMLIAELVAAVGTIELVGPVRHLESNFLNGIVSMDVRLRPSG